MKKINHTLTPKGNPLADYTEELVTYMKNLPKGKREKLLHQRLHQDLSKGIELRLLDEDEFVDRIEDRLKQGYKFTFIDNRPKGEDIEVNG